MAAPSFFTIFCPTPPEGGGWTGLSPREVKTFKIEEVIAANITNQKNAFKDENFNSNKWTEKEVTITVGTLDLPKDDRHYIRFQGTPILQIDGQNLGTFSTESPKLPVGSTFKATIETDPENKSKLKLKVVPDSLRTVATDLDTEETQTEEPMQPKNSKESEAEEIVKRLLAYAEAADLKKSIQKDTVICSDDIGNGQRLDIKKHDNLTVVEINFRPTINAKQGIVQEPPIFSATVDGRGTVKVNLDKLDDEDKQNVRLLPADKAGMLVQKLNEDFANLLDEFTENRGDYSGKDYDIEVKDKIDKLGQAVKIIVVKEKNKPEEDPPKFEAAFKENEIQVRNSSLTDSEREKLSSGLWKTIIKDRAKSSNEAENYQPPQPKQEKTYQDKLISDIAKTYQSIKNPDKLTEIPLDIDDWTAYVGKTGTCVIITSDKTPIYKGNIQTGKTAQELSDENLSKLIESKTRTIGTNQTKTDRLSTGNGNHQTNHQETTQNEYETLLISSLKDHYKSIPNPNKIEEIKLGIADWAAYIKEDGKCIIMTENREPIFKGNITTGKITEGLSEDNLKQMEEEMDKHSRNCEKNQHNGKPKATSKKPDIGIE